MNDIHRKELQHLVHEARRLRAKYADDPLVGAVIGFELAVRRLAFRLALA